jgi:hypothetical protein
VRLVLAVAAAVLLAGCSLPEREPPSAWVTAADAVCAEHVDEFRNVPGFTAKTLEDLQERELTAGSFVELERWAADFLAVGRRVEQEVEAVGEPSSPEERRWLELNRENGRVLERVRDAAAARDADGVYAGFERQAELSEEFIELSQELGFRTCGTVVTD